jgi:Skp family chaperone for outer membrane proteins
MQFSEFLSLLSKKKNEYENLINELEKNLVNEKKKLDESKIILNQKKLEPLIEEYYKNISNFEYKVDDINLYLSKLFDFNKQIIINEIIEISKSISIKKNIDVILDNNNYFIANDTIDISDIVIQDLNNKNIVFQLLNKEDLIDE